MSTWRFICLLKVLSAEKLVDGQKNNDLFSAEAKLYNLPGSVSTNLWWDCREETLGELAANGAAWNRCQSFN